MRCGILKYLTGILLSIVMTTELQSQMNYKITSYNSDDDLSQVTINDLLVDDENFLWIGTRDGLNKFDGSLFKQYRSKQTNPSIPVSNIIQSIAKDKNGTIWIGTPNTGLSYYNPDKNTFTAYPQKELGNSITALKYLESENQIWVGTESNGLFVLSPVSESTKPIEYLNDQSISGITAVDDRVFVGTTKGEVYVKNLKTDTDFKIYSDLGVSASEFYKHENNLLVCTTEGLFIINDLTKETKTIELETTLGTQTRFLKAFLKHTDSQVWIATGDGLFLFDMETEKSILKISNQDVNGQYLSNNTIRSLTRVSDDIIAVGTSNGLNIIDFSKGHFKNISKNLLGKRRLNDNVIFSIVKDLEDLWIGTTDGGLNLIRDDQSYFFYKDEDLGKMIEGTIRALKVDHQNKRLWVATTRGLHMVNLPIDNPKDINFRSFYSDPNNPNSISLNYIKDIDVDSKGRVWGATAGKGVFILELLHAGNVSISKYKSDDDVNPIVDDEVQIIKCHNEDVWVGCRGGLSVIANGEVRNYKHVQNEPNSLSDNSILDITFDKEDTPWIACRNGINKYLGNGEFQNWTNEGQQPETIVYSIQDDDEGIIWMGTGKGILRFDPLDETFVLYTKEDGIQGNEFDTHARFKDEKGNIYLGGIEGVTYFHPKDLKGMDSPKSIYFSNLLLHGDQNIRLNKNAGILELQKNDFPFNLQFSTLDFKNVGSIDFAYRLLPNNRNWTFLEKGNREIQFVNLPSGKSKLEINGFSRGEMWSSDPLSVAIQVKAVWWKRWWAWLTYSVVFLTLIYQLYKYQLSRKLLLNESQRLKDLDILKNEFYANITHEFRTPLTIIQGMISNLQSKNKPNENDNELVLLEKNSNKLLSLVNEILGLAKIENGSVELNYIQEDINKQLAYLVESFKFLAQRNSIELIFYPEQEEIIMDFDPEKLTTIVTNLISNAIKFTPDGGKIFVHSRIEDNENRAFSLSVKDSGRGIPKEDLAFVFKKYYQSKNQKDIVKGTGIGLALTKELIMIMDGNIEVESNEGVGSIFKVKLPIKNNANKEEFKFNKSFDLIEKPIELTYSKASEEDLPTILVVEDNNDIAQYLMSCLGNYNVLLASDGLQGKEMADLHFPEVVITDIMMPRLDGYELCKLLKSNPKTDHIPIIMLTARAEERDKLFGLSVGADAFLVKPFSRIELITRIDQLIESRRKLFKKVKTEGIESFVREKHQDPQIVFMQNAIKVIHDNIDSAIFGPPLFAKKMGLSESQLYKKLKAISGKSTALFIRSIRLEKAKTLILSTDKNIAEISYDTGFNDPSWFSRAFKKEFGFTPSEVEKPT